MICPNCGREIPDGTVCPCTLQPAPLSDNPALNVVKTIGSSPLFLAMTILLSVSTLLVIFSSAGLNDSIYNLYYYGYAMGLDMDALENMFDMMRSTSVVNAVLSSIPAILVAVAMWLHYISCRGRVSGNISTAGLTICKVIAYIRMICLCLATLLVVGVCVLAIVMVTADAFPTYALDPYGSFAGDELKLSIVIVFGIFAVIFLAVMLLIITYQASLIRMINRTKAVSESGMADERVSGYLVGMIYFTAVCSILSGIFTLFTAPISGAAVITQGVAYILMAQLLGRYRKGMNQVLFPPVLPVSPMQAGYMPQGYYDPNAPQAPYGGQPMGPADGFQQPPQQGNPPQQPPEQ